MCPAKTQISLGIRPVWSESSLLAWRKPGSLATHWAHSEDSDQTGWMPRLIWVFAGRTLILLVLSRGGSFVLYHSWLMGQKLQLKLVCFAIMLNSLFCSKKLQWQKKNGHSVLKFWSLTNFEQYIFFCAYGSSDLRIHAHYRRLVAQPCRVKHCQSWEEPLAYYLVIQHSAVLYLAEYSTLFLAIHIGCVAFLDAKLLLSVRKFSQ